MSSETKSSVVIVDTNKLNIHYHTKFMNEKQCEKIIDELRNVQYNTDEESAITVFGKKINIPRKQVAFGEPGTTYKFSGNTVEAEPWPQFIEDIRDEVQTYMIDNDMITEKQAKATPINYCLVNRYADGTEYIGWHRDDEKDLRKINGETFVVSLSFGATRAFHFRNYKAQKVKYPIDLESGDLLIMRGETNIYWQHSVPKRLRVKDPRWNLTFRFMY